VPLRLQGRRSRCIGLHKVLPAPMRLQDQGAVIAKLVSWLSSRTHNPCLPELSIPHLGLWYRIACLQRGQVSRAPASTKRNVFMRGFSSDAMLTGRIAQLHQPDHWTLPDMSSAGKMGMATIHRQAPGSDDSAQSTNPAASMPAHSSTCCRTHRNGPSALGQIGSHGPVRRIEMSGGFSFADSASRH